MPISINELLPKRIRKIHNGSELMLAYELDKYTRLMLGETLIVDVPIAKELFSGEHFSFVVDKGLNLNMDTSNLALADYSLFSRVAFTKTIEGVRFETETPDLIEYRFDFDQRANAVLHNDSRSLGYVSILAYFMVKAKKEGIKVPLLRICHEKYFHSELEYVDLLILKLHGNKIFEGMLEIQYSEFNGYQPEWEAFVIQNRQRDTMNREYTVDEKLKYMRKNFEVGDVVLYYKRSKCSQGKTISKLKACYPAVITKIEGKTIALQYFPFVQTRFTRHMELTQVENDLADDGRPPIYTEEDFERFYDPFVTYDVVSVGVDTCTYTEQDFFIKPVDFDGAYQYFKTKDGRTHHLFLSTLDVIYAVFEDRGVNYNKEKFLATHFVNREPVYDRFKREEEEAEQKVIQG